MTFITGPCDAGAMSKLTWLGHSGFLIESDGQRLSIDPWTDAPTFPGTDLRDVDVVLVTHGHHDHAGSAPDICTVSGATLVCIHEVTFWARGRGMPEDRIVGMNLGGTVEHGGWRITMVPAVHSGGCPGPDGHAHGLVPGGAAAGFVVETPDGQRIYHAGDTAAFLDMRLIGEMWSPTLALLPIGGHYTMDPRGAAKAVELLGVEHVVPMHYGTFPVLTGTPDQLREQVAGHVTVHVLEPGEALDLGAIA